MQYLRVQTMRVVLLATMAFLQCVSVVAQQLPNFRNEQLSMHMRINDILKQ
jgi:hypothetical protein